MVESRKKQAQTAQPSDEPPGEDTDERTEDEPRERLAALSLLALGVVYGDIGTSPLYALRESFFGLDHLPVTEPNVLGVLSLIFWSLIVVISLKYLVFVMRADNHGEGGILALMALLSPWKTKPNRGQRILIALGIFGAALLYGDGMITPAISVLSAVEGLHVAAPRVGTYVLPITVAILAGLFLLQRYGTGGLGKIFGPIMLLWFATLSVLGIYGIVGHPQVLAAVDPLHAIVFFWHNKLGGFLALGGIFLVVTGGEALYADMGHFGRRPIRLAWFLCVLPALLLNYFGQGALVIAQPEAMSNPFYQLAPTWAKYPLIALATVATIIASQAVISGVFSLTRQAVQLGQCPRINIVQTSAHEIGQIYVPMLNWIMMFATIGLVLGFKTSSHLASAYGVAVTTTMVITSLMLYRIMRVRWRWAWPFAAALSLVFLMVDLAFFSANIVKISDGGWFPLVVGFLVYLYMATWRRGRELLQDRLNESNEPLGHLIKRLHEDEPARVHGTAVFLTAPSENTPPMLLHHLTHNQVLHERVVLLSVTTENMPRISAQERLEVYQLDRTFFRVKARYGFMQSPNVPVALRLCERLGLKIDLDHTTFYLGRETLIPTDEVPGMMLWREKLFAFMSRNAARATGFYNIPSDRVVELGIQVEL